jgi:hypothetical protein
LIIKLRHFPTDELGLRFDSQDLLEQAKTRIQSDGFDLIKLQTSDEIADAQFHNLPPEAQACFRDQSQNIYIEYGMYETGGGPEDAGTPF